MIDRSAPWLGSTKASSLAHTSHTRSYIPEQPASVVPARGGGPRPPQSTRQQHQAPIVPVRERRGRAVWVQSIDRGCGGQSSGLRGRGSPLCPRRCVCRRGAGPFRLDESVSSSKERRAPWCIIDRLTNACISIGGSGLGLDECDPTDAIGAFVWPLEPSNFPPPLSVWIRQGRGTLHPNFIPYVCTPARQNARSNRPTAFEPDSTDSA